MPLALKEIKSLELLEKDYFFNKDNKLGEGGYGYVCKLLTNDNDCTTVGAIKVIHLKPSAAGNEVSCFVFFTHY